MNDGVLRRIYFEVMASGKDSPFKDTIAEVTEEEEAFKAFVANRIESEVIKGAIMDATISMNSAYEMQGFYAGLRTGVELLNDLRTVFPNWGKQKEGLTMLGLTGESMRGVALRNIKQYLECMEKFEERMASFE